MSPKKNPLKIDMTRSIDNIDRVPELLDFNRDQIDSAFDGAMTCAFKTESVSKRIAKRQWLCIHGPQAKEKRRLKSLEKDFNLNQNTILKKSIIKTRQVKTVPPLVKKEQCEAATNITYEIENGNFDFESALRKTVLDRIAVRETYLGELRSLIRLYPDSIEMAMDKKSKHYSKTTTRRIIELIENMRESIVSVVLSIDQWENMFISPKPFLFGGFAQEPINYLLSIASGTTFLFKHPLVSTILKIKAIDAEEILKCPLLVNPKSKLEHLECQALEIVRQHQKNFGDIADYSTCCSWCGIFPLPPKRIGKALVKCSTGAFCNKSRYCSFCIQANCGGQHGYRNIVVANSWTCFLCHGEEKKQEELKQIERMQYLKVIKERKLLKLKLEQEKAKTLCFQSKENRLKRQKAKSFLVKKSIYGFKILQNRRHAFATLKQQGQKLRNHFNARIAAKGWLKIKGLKCIKACIKEANEKSQIKPVLLSAIPYSEKMSSLDLHEQDVQFFLEEGVKHVENVVPIPEAWEEPGVQVDFKFALRVMYSESCLIRVTSTQRNLEIVKVTAYSSRKQKAIASVLLHKIQVTRAKRNTELLFILRNLAQTEFQAESRQWLGSLFQHASFMLQHYRVQYEQKRQLVLVAKKAKQFHTDQFSARSWLIAKGQNMKHHIQAQHMACSHFSRVIYMYKKQHLVRFGARNQLLELSTRLLNHEKKQRESVFELTAKANHYRTHIRVQIHAKYELQQLVIPD